jgi:hypothetical protein
MCGSQMWATQISHETNWPSIQPNTALVRAEYHIVQMTGFQIQNIFFTF